MRSKLAAAGLGVVIAVAVLGGAPSGGLANVQTARAERPLSPSLVRADFAELYATLQEAHYDPYARVPRAGYDQLFERMRDEINEPMTPDEAASFFQRFLAFGRIAHARVDAAEGAYAAHRQAGGNAFPLDVRIIGERIFVAGNGCCLADLEPGDEILSINGVTSSEWFDRAAGLLSADTPYLLGVLMEGNFRRLLWTELGDVPAFELRVRRSEGSPFDVVAASLGPNDLAAAQALQPARLELSWQARDARMLDGGIAYLRPGPAYNVDAQTEAAVYDYTAFKAFIDQAFTNFLDAGATDLIIDLRDNPGGDNSFSDLLVAWIATRPFRFTSSFTIKVSDPTIASNARRLAVPGNDPTGVSAALAEAYSRASPGALIDFPINEVHPRDGRRFEGRVYALINRRSFSNTVAVAAILQDYGFATLIGEETSDLATTYGAMETFALSRTGLAVGYPKALILRPNGSRAPRGVVPDIVIDTPIVESPEDPVLQRAMQIIRDAQNANGSGRRHGITGQ